MSRLQRAGMNPFFDAYPTSLSKLSDHDWTVLSNQWSRFSGFHFVSKLGRKWNVADAFGGNVPGVLFNTKTEAERYVSNLILAESRHRAFLKHEGKTA